MRFLQISAVDEFVLKSVLNVSQNGALNGAEMAPRALRVRTLMHFGAFFDEAVFH